MILSMAILNPTPAMICPSSPKTVLGMPESSERQIAERLQARIAHALGGKQ
jgi:hypothetical protein